VIAIVEIGRALKKGHIFCTILATASSKMQAKSNTGEQKGAYVILGIGRIKPLPGNISAKF